MRRTAFISVLSVIALTVSFFLLSCSKTTPAPASAADRDRPDLMFKEVTYVLGRSAFPPVTLHASSMEIRNEAATARLEDVTFFQNDEDGTPLMSGSCDRATVNTDDFSAVLEGSVRIERPQDGLVIVGADIAWDNENQRISTDKEVFLEYDSSSEIHGIGLTGDFRISHYELDEIIEGRLEK